MWRKNNEEFNAKETKKQMAQRDARKAQQLGSLGWTDVFPIENLWFQISIASHVTGSSREDINSKEMSPKLSATKNWEKSQGETLVFMTEIISSFVRN